MDGERRSLRHGWHLMLVAAHTSKRDAFQTYVGESFPYVDIAIPELVYTLSVDLAYAGLLGLYVEAISEPVCGTPCTASHLRERRVATSTNPMTVGHEGLSNARSISSRGVGRWISRTARGAIRRCEGCGRCVTARPSGAVVFRRCHIGSRRSFASAFVVGRKVDSARASDREGHDEGRDSIRHKGPVARPSRMILPRCVRYPSGTHGETRRSACAGTRQRARAPVGRQRKSVPIQDVGERRPRTGVYCKTAFSTHLGRNGPFGHAQHAHGARMRSGHTASAVGAP